MNEYVFPQTPAKDKNFNRTGGLTKREYIALHIYCSAPDTVTMYRAFTLADDFIKAAEKLPKKPDVTSEDLSGVHVKNFQNT